MRKRNCCKRQEGNIRREYANKNDPRWNGEEIEEEAFTLVYSLTSEQCRTSSFDHMELFVRTKADC